MDELLIRQLTRQLKILNFWVTFFGTLFLVGFVIFGCILYVAFREVHKAETSFTSFQQKTENDLNIQQQLCSNSTIKDLLGSKSSECQ